MTEVTVYSTGPACQRCRLTCRRLDELGIRYDLIEIHEEHNAALRAYLVDELGYAEAPVVVVGDGPESSWAGFRPDRIDALATRPGTVGR
ncbi:glutaredoxin family protein [Microbacterium sp. KHB019]|uniref:glutaredoxin family protein n=1 Tax=Microbacterium sp. KHB019 TaxID=3129770 RepID=UPI00307A50E3